MGGQTRHTQTIFALSSGRGRAGVAVIRMSGPKSRFVLETISGKSAQARRVDVSHLRARDGEVLDQAVTLFFEAPHSFTGEDCAEFQVHGGRAVIAALLQELGRFPDCRSAEPGEFTQRALENGKIDLIGAEALVDLIDAETDAQRRLAMVGRSGRLRDEIERLRSDLIEAMALLEAEIDFSDEADVTGICQLLAPVIERSRRGVEAMLLASTRAEQLRTGFKVVLAGAVNAGKSTLLNALAKRDIAIVSPIPGTTRDWLEAHLDIKGWPITVIDTAGLRETADPIETLGIARSARAVSQADLVLHLSNDGVWPEIESRAPVRIRTQIDSFPIQAGDEDVLSISALTGVGLDQLLDLIESEASKQMSIGEEPVTTSKRQYEALQTAASMIEMLDVSDGRPLELTVEDLRLICARLGEIIGNVDSDTVRCYIFSRFCIGK